MTEQAKKVELDCGHILWLITIPDTIDDMLYCTRCERYTEIAPAAAKLRGVWVFDPQGEFKSIRHSKRSFTGVCLYEDCEETYNSTNYVTLRERLHAHYMRRHTRFKVVEIEYVDIKPKPGDPPPF